MRGACNDRVVKASCTPKRSKHRAMGQNNEDIDPVEDALERGWLALEAGRPFDAAKQVDEALALEPDSPDAFTLTGAIKASLGDTDAALEAYERASELDPEYVDPLLSAAELLLDLGEAKDALEL